MHRYGISIYWSNEDQLYIAAAPELPGCVTHGETQEDALANLAQAVQLWVDTAKEFGNPVPEPTGQSVSLDVVKREQSQAERKQKPVTMPLRKKSKHKIYYDARTSRTMTNPNLAKRHS
jgi:predicted RNase H-like HicB family nuclease